MHLPAALEASTGTSRWNAPVSGMSQQTVHHCHAGTSHACIPPITLKKSGSVLKRRASPPRHRSKKQPPWLAHQTPLAHTYTYSAVRGSQKHEQPRENKAERCSKATSGQPCVCLRTTTTRIDKARTEHASCGLHITAHETRDARSKFTLFCVTRPFDTRRAARPQGNVGLRGRAPGHRPGKKTVRVGQINGGTHRACVEQDVEISSPPVLPLPPPKYFPRSSTPMHVSIRSSIWVL